MLCVTLGHKPSFVTFDGAINTMFDVINPPITNWNLAWGKSVRYEVWFASRVCNSSFIAFINTVSYLTAYAYVLGSEIFEMAKVYIWDD